MRAEAVYCVISVEIVDEPITVVTGSGSSSFWSDTVIGRGGFLGELWDAWQLPFVSSFLGAREGCCAVNFV